MKLYGYWRSGAAWRVRIALHYKEIPFQSVAVHLVRDGGEHNAPAYRAINPQGRVPALGLDDGTVLVQSGAILEWIEETYPKPPLLPKEPVARARARGIAQIIGADVHPLVNAAGVLPYLRRELNATDAAVADWIAHWSRAGFGAIETMIGNGPYCCGEQPTLADVYLVPQVAAARRFKVPLDDYPRILRVVEECAKLYAFKRAEPQNQPDAE